jgi:cytochrome c oxidase subunit 3
MSLYRQATSKPWEYQGPVSGSGPEMAFEKNSEKIALTLFLVVVSVIFSLLTVTYYLRMDLGDWVPLADPGLLWFNTVVLFLGSVALQRATVLARSDRMPQARTAFIAGGALAALFIAGQCYVWMQLDSGDLGVATNPSSAFFYLLTGMHLVHLLGGLWVWSRASFRFFGNIDSSDALLSIELCTTYAHFLFLLWVLLFGILLST